MDQLKEFLRQCIKYRFWIAVSLAMIFSIAAYAAGSGPVKEKAAKQTTEIDGAKKKVQAYSSPTVPTAKYSELLNEKTGELTKDVTASWTKLYASQAPLLAWPSRVHERFTKWGRKWPEGVDSSTVQFAIIDYVNLYPKYVTEVYKTFNPFDPETGEGVVSAPPEATLLRPAPFKEETPPSLGKVWAAQERLWIQRTLLDVVASVNKNAKIWDGAAIRQILTLEVGTQTAQDQRSIAKGEALVEAEPLDDPSKPAPEAADAATPEMAMMGSGMGGYSGGAAPGASESVYYITPKDESAKSQFKIMPVQISVLIDQARIQEFLVALENSPMTIQVMDFELAKPEARVMKPEQGQNMGMFGNMMMNDMAFQKMMMPGMSGMGGMYARQSGMLNDSIMMSGMSGMGMGGSGGGAPAKKGIDKRTQNLAAEAKKQREAALKAAGKSLFDPYYNIVSVTVYGQARFFNPPPPVEAAEPSQAEAPADAEKKDETPKTGDAEKKDETPKTDDAEKKDETKKDETPKAEAAKSDAAKPETPKAEAAKSDVAKPETPKAEAPKTETPKADPVTPPSK